MSLPGHTPCGVHLTGGLHKATNSRESHTHPYRLPSEAEWEYACRAVTMTPFYCGKTIMPVLANYTIAATRMPAGSTGTFRKKAVNSGSFPPNAFGLYDMRRKQRFRCGTKDFALFNIGIPKRYA